MKYKLLAYIFVCFLSNQAFAKCDPSVGKHLPGVTPPNYLGNSRTDSFDCAIRGGSELTLAQINERNELIPPKLDNRFYVRLGFNAATESLVSIKNSSQTTNAKNGKVQDTTAKTASNNIEIAFGYTWSDFALDIEWLGLKSVAYNSSLTQISPIASYTASVRGDAYLANLYWIFYDAYNFKFYGIGDIGFTNNKCTTTLSGGQTNVINKKYSVSYGGGIGARFNVISNLYADMSARYLRLGELRFEASNTNYYMTLKGARTWLGLSVRVLWLI